MIKALISDSGFRLRVSYALLCGICFLQLLFLAVFIFFTTDLIQQRFEAADFLRQAEVIPLPATLILGGTLLLYPMLLGVMQLRGHVREKPWSALAFLLLESVICMALLRLTSFAGNQIFLLVAANMLTLTRDRKNRGIGLIILVILFLCTNDHVVSAFVPITSFERYLYPYTAQSASLFQGTASALSTSVLILFLVYILFLIQDQMLESAQMRRINDELRTLNHQLEEMADVREKMGETRERNRLAREIHDTLGHTLTGLSTGIDAAKTLLQRDPDMAIKQLDILSATAREGLKDVRRSVRKLRPDALENHTLKGALETMIEEFMRSSGVKVSYVCHLDSLDFQPDEEDTIYRIVQECMTNSVRHGHASRIYISFGKDQDSLILIIEDDGKGCVDIQEGFGLHHMKERIALLNGNVRFYGRDGFEVLVELPLRKEDERI
ncbi:MAG TPA: sensor histidine kinase [Candidatus Merdibacter merdavium]|uniref:histidine kinase n=1 Tax=Candidatus Merdibacter merdavium TaxID=2838692 RepID=A0A9D2NQD4_9FIRM|nr:sensor histidine kinase [Candidatus Merdibacter merdavium]